jgi:hypothetical protein
MVADAYGTAAVNGIVARVEAVADGDIIAIGDTSFDLGAALIAAGSMRLRLNVDPDGTVKVVDGGTLPELIVDYNDYPDLADNIYNAQMAGHSNILTHVGGSTSHSNRLAALEDVPNIRPWSRDEYPLASAKEGGAGSWVGHISRNEQCAQGGLLTNLGVRSGDRYRVRVVNHPGQMGQ